ncbi:hypothetical protein HYC85_029698, partial [Camellia sinensis]
TSLSLSVLHGFIVISLLLLILLGFISNAAQSLRFDLQSGHSKCIAEYIKTNSMFVPKYTIVNPNNPHPFPESHKITVRSTITIDFDWKTGVAAKDWTNVAKKGTIDVTKQGLWVFFASVFVCRVGPIDQFRLSHEEVQSTILQSSKERIWGSNAKSPVKGTWEWLWEKQGTKSWKPFSSKHSFELQVIFLERTVKTIIFSLY